MRHWLKPRLSMELPDGLSSERWWLVLQSSLLDGHLPAIFRASPPPADAALLRQTPTDLGTIVGLAFWALEFPMLRRLTREQRERHPHLHAAATAKPPNALCRHAENGPYIAIYNFVEILIFTPAKQAAQASPYRHLLRPRAGGASPRSSARFETALRHPRCRPLRQPQPHFLGFCAVAKRPVIAQRCTAVPVL
ncbi:hypothetical protein DSL92_08995 [Billgrantia gudaonensis]|uniref:Uncharacterized protein n=1 Tax=Billgrantia gudaonensis TaxID=376427 RepID=A0A3S0VS99_9GAMM|nr:hypothetical protein DSL92_08995 [Halomonas gudaonensis]